MGRLTLIQHADTTTNEWIALYPQTVTQNVFRENGSLLEESLVDYDAHADNVKIHVNRALSTGNGSALLASCDGVTLCDGFPLMLTLHIDLECAPTLAFNGNPAAYIVTSDGNKIIGGQVANSVLFIVWSASLSAWFLLNSDQVGQMTTVKLPTVTEYNYTCTSADTSVFTIPNFNNTTDALVINFGQTILRKGTDYCFLNKSTIKLIGITLNIGHVLTCSITKFTDVSKKGILNYTLEIDSITHEIKEGESTQVPLPSISDTVYSIAVNYNQTVLRNGIDYIQPDGADYITMLTFEFNPGDLIVYTVSRYLETNSVLLGNANGANGTYRYQVTTRNGSYTAVTDDVSVFAVPDFDRKRDHVMFVYENKVLVKDADYVLDSDGNCVLLTMMLDANQTIYFTVLEGAYADIYRFNVADAYGTGKDMLVNISWSEVCDFYCLMVKLPHTLEGSPTLKFLNGPAVDIYGINDARVAGGNAGGSFLYIVYNESKNRFYCLGDTSLNLTPVIADPFITGFDAFTGTVNLGDGTINFGETVIQHGLGTTPTRYDVTPSEPPSIVNGSVTNIGDIWIRADATNLYVGNAGTSTSSFKWTVYK